jgi:hypothetical protein
VTLRRKIGTYDDYSAQNIIISVRRTDTSAKIIETSEAPIPHACRFRQEIQAL